LNFDGLGSSDIGAWLHFPAQRQPRPVVLLDQRVKVNETASRITRPGPTSSRPPTKVLGVCIAEIPTATARSLRAWAEVQHDFVTDRGPTKLRAYSLTFTKPSLSCIVLDPDVKVFWPHGDFDITSRSYAHVAADGRHLEIQISASMGDEIPSVVRFQEFSSVVVMEPPVVRAKADRRPTRAALRTRWVPGFLDTPLGNRVLIGAAGVPVAVLDAREALA
jgi:hypothetical protein